MLHTILAVVILWPISSLVAYGLYKGHVLNRIKKGLQVRFSFLRNEGMARFIAFTAPVSLLLLIPMIIVRSIRDETNEFGWAWDIPCQYRQSPIHDTKERCDHCEAREKHLAALLQ